MISLSLCMIVKNEEAVLERILKPVSQVMDAILIADTGSSDRTKEIAEQYTSQVFDFPWCDDFSAPRNFLLEKVRTDYWMWLDADDVLDEENLEKLKSLKETLDPGTDVVMMEYAAGFDQSGRTTFSYFRERIMKTSRNFRWNGAVHETVIPEGNIIYSDVVIRHRKCGKGDPDRNLRIYEKMLAGGETLEPRHQLYYGRELYYHQRYPETEAVLVEFLKNPSGWLENKIDACFVLGQCYRKMREQKNALEAFLYSLTMDVPRAEICCEVGGIFWKESCTDRLPTGTGRRLLCRQIRKKEVFLWLSAMDLYRICSFVFVMIGWDARSRHSFFIRRRENRNRKILEYCITRNIFGKNMVWYKKKDIFIVLAGCRLVGIVCTGKCCCHIL